MPELDPCLWLLASQDVPSPVPLEGCWEDQRGCPAAGFPTQKTTKFGGPLGHWRVRTLIGFDVYVILIYVIYFSLLHGLRADRKLRCVAFPFQVTWRPEDAYLIVLKLGSIRVGPPTFVHRLRGF